MYENYIGKPLDDDIEMIIGDVVKRHHGRLTEFNDKKIEFELRSGRKTIGHKDFYITYIHGTSDIVFDRILDVLTCR